MSCCAVGAATMVAAGGQASPASEELWLASRDLGGGLRQIELSVPGAYCGACIATIEGALRVKAEVERARVNLSSRRVSIVWKEEVGGRRTDPCDFLHAIAERGYQAHLFSPAGRKAMTC